MDKDKFPIAEPDHEQRGIENIINFKKNRIKIWNLKPK
jgi:hypothetical protein